MGVEDPRSGCLDFTTSCLDGQSLCICAGSLSSHAPPVPGGWDGPGGEKGASSARPGLLHVCVAGSHTPVGRGSELRSPRHTSARVYMHMSARTHSTALLSQFGGGQQSSRGLEVKPTGEGPPNYLQRFPTLPCNGQGGQAELFFIVFSFSSFLGDPSLLSDVWSSKSLITAFCH